MTDEEFLNKLRAASTPDEITRKKESDLRFAEYVKASRVCSECGQESDGKGSIKLHRADGGRVAFAWRARIEKIKSYTALCRTCSRASLENRTETYAFKDVTNPSPTTDIKDWLNFYLACIKVRYNKATNQQLGIVEIAKIYEAEVENVNNEFTALMAAPKKPEH